MTVPDPIGSITTPTGKLGQDTGFSVGSSARSSGVDTGADKDMFLKLLVAQMKYQDPTKPTDASQFLAQTAQFTVVEKLGALQDSQAQILSSTQLQAATAMVGSTVSWNGTDATGTAVTHSGTVSGVTVSGGTPTLLVGDEQVALADVTKVTGPASGR